MRQLSLHTMLCCKSVLEPTSGECLECYDLFCGCGGWSTGAVQAGHSVVFACDNSEKALLAHAANHPGTEHRQLELPSAAIPFPTDGRPFHCHGSPPCQQFSSMRTKRANDAPDADAKAEGLVEWYLETALSCGATSWSMEQVPSASVIRAVERAQQMHRGRVDYGIFQLRNLGVPQTRKRLLAGSPELIARLKRLACRSLRRSVRDVVPRPRGTHVRSTKLWEKKVPRVDRKPGEAKYTYVRSDDPMYGSHTVDGPGPTVCAGNQPYWVDRRDPLKRMRFNVRECAALQTFPDGYKLPENLGDAQLLIGNAVPPLVAKLMMMQTDASQRQLPQSPSLRREPPSPRWSRPSRTTARAQPAREATRHSAR